MAIKCNDHLAGYVKMSEMVRGQMMDGEEHDNGNDRDAVMVAKSSNLITHHFFFVDKSALHERTCAFARPVNGDINKLTTAIIKCIHI